MRSTISLGPGGQTPMPTPNFVAGQENERPGVLFLDLDQHPRDDQDQLYPSIRHREVPPEIARLFTLSETPPPFSLQDFFLRSRQNRPIKLRELLACGGAFTSHERFSLDLSEGGVTDQSLDDINARFPYIFAVQASCHSTNNILALLPRLGNLTELNLGRREPAIQYDCEDILDLSPLENLHNLRLLDLYCCEEIDDDMIRNLNLPHLKDVNLAGCQRISSNGLAQWHLPSLQTLRLKNSLITNFACLSHFQNLHTLILDGTFFTGDDLATLVNLPHLCSFSIMNNLHICSLINLENLQNFVSLNLINCPRIGDDTLALLSALTDNIYGHTYLNIQSLSFLDLYNAEIKEENLYSTNKRLTFLDLTGTEITDSGLFCLGYVSSLKSLTLYRCCKITDYGLKQLSRLGHLEYLNLVDCRQITDNGLACLSTLQRLRTLDLRGCDHVTRSGIAYLENQLPGLDIFSDH